MNTRKRQFTDRSSLIFGREPDLKYLIERAHKKGITVVYGNPRMGKTWLLHELGRRLAEDYYFRVGHKERTVEQEDLFLRTVANLYEWWFRSESPNEKLKQFWNNNKTKISQSAGAVLGEILRDVVPAGSSIATAIKATVDICAQHSNSPFNLPRLDYEVAYEYLDLIYRETNQQNITLVLDAWDHAKNLDHDLSLFTAFLNHIDEWAQCHIFLGVRFPKEGDAEDITKYISRIRILEQEHPGYISFFNIPRLHFEESENVTKLIKHLHRTIPVTRNCTNEVLLRAIDGFPGVLERWGNPYLKANNADELLKQAIDAHTNLWPEVEWLLNKLNESELRVVIRLAMLPPLSIRLWKSIGSIIEKEQNSGIYKHLIHKGVLWPSEFPTFGHLTRHEAIRNVLRRDGRWLNDEREIADDLAKELALGVTGLDENSMMCANCLGDLVRFPDGDISHIFASAALFAYPNTQQRELLEYAKGREPSLHQLPSQWENLAIKHQDMKSFFQLCILGYGMTSCDVGEYQVAIDAIDIGIRMEEFTNLQFLQYFLTRAHAYQALMRFDDAIKDLDHVLNEVGLDSTPLALALRSVAYPSRGIAHAQSGNHELAILDFDRTLEYGDNLEYYTTRNSALKDVIIPAIKNRIISKIAINDLEGVINDYGIMSGYYDGEITVQAELLIATSKVKFQLKQYLEAESDCTQVLEMQSLQNSLFSVAYAGRALARVELKNYDGALNDVNKRIALPDIELSDTLKAHLFRGGLKVMFFNDEKGFQEILDTRAKAVENGCTEIVKHCDESLDILKYQKIIPG